MNWEFTTWRATYGSIYTIFVAPIQKNHKSTLWATSAVIRPISVEVVQLGIVGTTVCRLDMPLLLFLKATNQVAVLSALCSTPTA